MTRIIAGELGGRRLATPPGDRTRPTSDRVREALFGALSAARDLSQTRVLDLYAGSGAVGVEAISRGAAYAMFIESHPKTAGLLRRNLAGLGVSDRAKVVAASVPSILAEGADDPFDVVFADPPYSLDTDRIGSMLNLLLAHGWLSEDADIIVERSARDDALTWPEGLTEMRSRRYGESMLWYGRRLWT